MPAAHPPGGVGRIAYLGRYDLTVLPVNYRVVNGDILFRTASDSITGQDLRTGLANADFKVAFEIDDLDERAQEGWSGAPVQGPAHHLDSPADQEAAEAAGLYSWARQNKDHFIRIRPRRITGRRVRQAPDPRRPIRPAGPHPHPHGGSHDRAATAAGGNQWLRTCWPCVRAPRPGAR